MNTPPTLRSSVLKENKGVMQMTDIVKAPVAIKTNVRAEAKTTKSVEKAGLAQPSAEAVARRNRRTRSPIDGRRNILTVKGLAPGMVGRWVDNLPERVEQLEERGYEPVRKPVQIGDMNIDSGAEFGAVITKRVGGGREQILMQIPKEWYDADQAEKQKIVDARETATRQGDKSQNFYGKVTTDDVVGGKTPQRRGSED
jgi:hypothetical protein